MAIGDVFRLWAQVPVGTAVVSHVLFARQLNDAGFPGSQQLATRWIVSKTNNLDALLSDQLGQGIILVEALPPNAGESYSQVQFFGGLDTNPPIDASVSLYAQASPSPTSRSPSQLIAMPGLTTEQVLSGSLTNAARNAWATALQAFMAGFTGTGVPTVFELVIVPYGQLAYPLPDASAPQLVERLEAVPTIRPQPVTNIRLRA